MPPTQLSGQYNVKQFVAVATEAIQPRLRQELALIIEEIRIKDARMLRIPAQRRPHYPPTERLAMLELRAVRGWSVSQTARRLLVTPATVCSWMHRLDEYGPHSPLVPASRYSPTIRRSRQARKHRDRRATDSNAQDRVHAAAASRAVREIDLQTRTDRSADTRKTPGSSADGPGVDDVVALRHRITDVADPVDVGVFL